MKSSAALLILMAAGGSIASSSIDIRKSDGSSVPIAVGDIDSITYDIGSSSTDMLIHTGRGTKIHSVAGIDSILLGDRAVSWEVVPQSKHQYLVTGNRVEAFDFGVNTWGPGWAWMNLGGEVSTAGGKRTVTGSKAVKGSDATVSFTHSAEQISPSTVSLSWDFTFDRAVDGPKFIVGPSMKSLFGTGGRTVVIRPDNTREVEASSFNRGEISGDAQGFIFISSAGDSVRLDLGEATGISSDGGRLRISMIPSSVQAGETYTTSATMTFPKPVRFYVDENDVPRGTDMSAWFPFSVGEYGTPVDLSFLNKDADGTFIEAGSHGFLSVEGDRFVFEDGTQGRFWGVNITAGAAKGSFDRSAQLADRLSRLGINVVRLHHLDSWWSNSLIDKDHPDGTTRHLDPENLRNLDRFIYEMKQKGIYVVLDPWVGRQFRENDSVPGWETMTGNFGLHPYVFFDDRIQMLTKKYLEQVWTHVNEFTGVAYKDEPAIIFTEIVNEGLWRGAGGVKLEPYRSDFLALYEQWCTDNNRPYDGDEIIKQNYGKDHIDFFQYVIERFYREMYDFLRGIGVRVPINATNWSLWTWEIPPQAEYDFMDVHHYYGGDIIGAGTRLGGIWVEHAIDAKSTPWGKMAVHAVDGKPFSVSECGQNPPKTYRGAYYPSFAAMACFQGWDNITGYAYSQSGSPRRKLDTYGWESDPVTVAGLAMGSLIYRRRDVQPAQQTVVMQVPDDEQYILRWENDGEKSIKNLAEFNAALETHRTVLHFGNTVPASSGAVDVLTVDDAFAYQHSSTELTSDTDELWRDWEKGAGTINTPRTQCAFGWIGSRNERFTTADCSFDIKTPYASVNVSSLTDQPVAASTRLLIVASARAFNSGTRLSVSETEIAVSGSAPVLVEPVVGTIEIATGKKQCTLYPVSVDGTRGTGITVPVSDGKARVELKAEYATLFYELE